MNFTTLEQSKKLKAWGAPQFIGKWWFPHREMETGELIEWRLLNNGAGSEESIAAYNLEELIEWLGDDFDNLGQWSGLEVKYYACSPDGFNGYGKIPLEAVFALAEALHGKGNK